MRQLISVSDHVLRAKKLLTANPLHLPLVIVHKNLRRSGPLRPCHHRRREDRRHPPRRGGMVPAWPVNEDDVPSHVVELVGEVVNGETTIGEQEVLNGAALGLDLRSGGGEEFREFLDLGYIRDIVGFEAGMAFFEVGGVVLVFIEEDGAAAVVESTPEEGFLAETEDEEIARGATAENGGDGAEVTIVHTGR